MISVVPFTGGGSYAFLIAIARSVMYNRRYVMEVVFLFMYDLCSIPFGSRVTIVHVKERVMTRVTDTRIFLVLFVFGVRDRLP